MDAGFRRSGRIIYQPACAGCRECVPLRVEVGKLALSKGQRRVLRKNHDLVIRVAPPEPSAEKWNLYCRYQRDWHAGGQIGTPADFVRFLYQSPVDTIEFEYRDSTGAAAGRGDAAISRPAVSPASISTLIPPTAAARWELSAPSMKCNGPATATSPSGTPATGFSTAPPCNTNPASTPPKPSAPTESGARSQHHDRAGLIVLGFSWNIH